MLGVSLMTLEHMPWLEIVKTSAPDRGGRACDGVRRFLDLPSAPATYEMQRAEERAGDDGAPEEISPAPFYATQHGKNENSPATITTVMEAPRARRPISLKAINTKRSTLMAKIHVGLLGAREVSA